MSPNCETCEVEESNIHMFLYCYKIQGCINLLYRVLFYFSNINFKDNLLKLLFLEFPGVDKKIRNTICITISAYIACVWYNREDASYIEYKLKAKIIKGQKYHKLILKEKIYDVFTENYCNIDTDIIKLL